MKIRNGFVSNSSSSSFVLRGITMKVDELAKILKIGPETKDSEWEIMKKIKKPLVAFSNRDFFDGPETGEMVVGEVFCCLEDGVVEQLPEPDDNLIKHKLMKQLGIEPKKLYTYAQFISNDNY